MAYSSLLRTCTYATFLSIASCDNNSPPRHDSDGGIQHERRDPIPDCRGEEGFANYLEIHTGRFDVGTTLEFPFAGTRVELLLEDVVEDAQAELRVRRIGSQDPYPNGYLVTQLGFPYNAARVCDFAPAHDEIVADDAGVRIGAADHLYQGIEVWVNFPRTFEGSADIEVKVCRYEVLTLQECTQPPQLIREEWPQDGIDSGVPQWPAQSDAGIDNGN